MQRTSRHSTATWLTATAFLLAFPAQAETLKLRSAEGDLVLVSAPRQASYLARANDGIRIPLPLAPTAFVHSAATFGSGSQWYAAGVDRAAEGRRLVVLKGSGTKTKELPAPPVLDAAQLDEPSLLVDERGLLALAWVEGKAARRQVVRMASWTAGGWREPVTVSPRGPGSQMALAATVLADGSCLLAWAAFDGQDDEILWSRSTESGTSVPARLGTDNEVPDITPQLWPTPDGGAFAAWSRYDGNDYRVHLARFDGRSWSEPEVVGPRGSLYPTFHEGPEGAILMYQKALPRGWYVAELDEKGRVRRETGVETMADERPLIADVTSREVSLMWIDPSGVGSTTTSGLAWR